MRIAVYSGSFDPLHIGHEAIMHKLTRGGGFDWVYLVISPQNPFKDPSKADTGAARYRAAVEAVHRHPGLHVTVDDIELSMTPPSYTIRTLDALKEREPGNEFTLVIGADNLERFGGWREAGRILREYGLAVYPRDGYDMDRLIADLHEEFPGSRICTIDAPMVNISSTEIRNKKALGQDMSEWLM